MSPLYRELVQQHILIQETQCKQIYTNSINEILLEVDNPIEAQCHHHPCVAVRMEWKEWPLEKPNHTSSLINNKHNKKSKHFSMRVSQAFERDGSIMLTDVE